jgi:hypothetical protein
MIEVSARLEGRRIVGASSAGVLAVDWLSKAQGEAGHTVSDDYVEQRLGEGADRESVRKELVTLQRALTLAHQRKLLEIDPRGVIPRMRSHHVPRDRYLSELQLLMAQVSLGEAP